MAIGAGLHAGDGARRLSATAGVSGGQATWQESAKGRKHSKGLNPLGRGEGPARPPARDVGALFDVILCIRWSWLPLG